MYNVWVLYVPSLLSLAVVHCERCMTSVNCLFLSSIHSATHITLRCRDVNAWRTVSPVQQYSIETALMTSLLMCLCRFHGDRLSNWYPICLVASSQLLVFMRVLHQSIRAHRSLNIRVLFINFFSQFRAHNVSLTFMASLTTTNVCTLWHVGR